MTKDKAIAELVRIWHSPHLDLSLKAGLAEAIETLKEKNRSDSLVRDDAENCKESESKLDLISRQAALDAIMGEPTDAHYPSWYAQKIKLLPSATCDDCIWHICNYNQIDWEMVDTMAEPKTGEWIWSDEDASWKCVCCDCVFEEIDWKPDYNYCPNCGARMKGCDSE